MKKTLFSISILSFLFVSCSDNSIEQLNEAKKPVVVFTEYDSETWYETPSMTIKDADGDIIVLSNDQYLLGLIKKYDVNDTIY